ncbi:MAG: sedoheptulose 7-phosphate cyclase [Legionellales bacterium]|nr:sedoheptulose 7-phosphate cyclase [Legionellales bacterium]
MKTHKTWELHYTRPIHYSIESTIDLFNPENPILLSGGLGRGSARFIVVDSTVYDLYERQIEDYFSANTIKTQILRFVAGEQNKSLSGYQDILWSLEQFPIARRSEPILAIGGGVLTDLVGFVASTYRRGVPHIKIPTTLMGYIDAAIGIKTGLNIQDHKNRLGSFEPPLKVILDRTFLTSLSKRQILNGVAEIIKLAVVNDLSLFEHLERSGKASIDAHFQNEEGLALLEKSITGIVNLLEPNLYEDNLARTLDFGHTFSPAFEMKAKGALLHGEAVIIGVVLCSALAYLKRLLSWDELNRILSLIQTLELPLDFQHISPEIMLQSLIERTHHRDGQQNVPLPNGIGQCVFANDLTESDLRAVCNFLSKEKNVCFT